MQTTLTTIKHEHRNLGAVLICLKALADELDEEGIEPDFRVFHAILTYIDTFLERFHHPKEEAHLFPALLRRHPEAKGVLSELEAQHREGADRLHDLRRALSILEFRGRKELHAFREVVTSYTNFEQRHAFEEEQQVFPLAERYLHEQDWAPIEAAFSSNDDPLFGDNRKKEFEDLHTVIVGLTPAPYGFGHRWDAKPEKKGAGGLWARLRQQHAN